MRVKEGLRGSMVPADEAAKARELRPRKVSGIATKMRIRAISGKLNNALVRFNFFHIQVTTIIPVGEAVKAHG